MALFADEEHEGKLCSIILQVVMSELIILVKPGSQLSTLASIYMIKKLTSLLEPTALAHALIV